MANLPGETWLRFVVWMAVGIALYFAYGRRRSRLAAGGNLDPATAGEREAARGRDTT
jgi:APA family basic amino acid/polyamine antiporter